MLLYILETGQEGGTVSEVPVGPCRGMAAARALCSWSFASLWDPVQVAAERGILRGRRKDGGGYTTLGESWWLGVAICKRSASL